MITASSILYFKTIGKGENYQMVYNKCCHMETHTIRTAKAPLKSFGKYFKKKLSVLVPS